MIAVTVNGQKCWLVPYEPGDGSAKLEVAIPMIEARSLTGRPVRRSTALLPRHTLTWTALVDAADFATLRDASLASQDEPIIAPLWPHAYAPSSVSATITGGLMVGYAADWSSYAINPSDFSAYANAAPCIYGRFKQPPRLVSTTGCLVQAQFIVEEDAPGAYALAPVSGILAADATSEASGGGTWPVFPFDAEWTKEPQPGLGVYDVDRQSIGYGRIKATVFYPQTPERVFSADFQGFGSSAAAQWIAWWIRHSGCADAHIVSLDGFGVQNGQSILARHTNDTLAISYDGGHASTAFSWRESAMENNVPTGETLGTTIGRMPTDAWFFAITLDYNGATRSWYLTDYEGGGIIANGQTWSYNACTFDGFTQSNDCEDDQTNATFRYFAGGPWDNWLPGALAARGFLTVYRGDVQPDGSVANFQQVSPTSELSVPSLDGPLVKWKALGANAIFARKAPRQMMSTSCCTDLFSTRCGLSMAAYTFGATVVSLSSNVLTVGSFTPPTGGSLPSGYGEQDWFSLGFVIWYDSNGMPQRSGILTSAAQDGSGNIAMTLDRPPALSAGATVSAVPGCDKLYASGCLKFNNQNNHRGFEMMPDISPNFVIPIPNQSSAKK